MIVTIDGGVVRKSATSPAEIERLSREAAVLRIARHPGVVRLLRSDRGVLETRLVQGWRLGGGDGLSADEAAGVGAALATTLADLHDLGVVHGGIEAAHILYDDRCRPVLCGFGQGATGVGRKDPAMAGDVAALAGVLIDLLREGDGPDRLRRTLSRAGRGRLSAGALAAACAAWPGATLPGAVGEPVVGCPSSDRRRPARKGTVFAVAAALSLLMAAALRPGGHGRPLLVGRPGEEVVTGRWFCDKREKAALPALLRPARGSVWVWDEWPAPARRAPGRRTARVDQAVALSVLHRRGGCDLLLVKRRVGPPVAVVLDRPPVPRP